MRFSERGWTRVATHAVRNGRWQAWAAWPWLWLGLCAGPLRAQVDSTATQPAALAPVIYKSAKLVGERVVDDAELLRALRLPVPADSLRAALARLVGVLSDRGYLGATVQPEPAAPGVLQLRIEAGSPAHLAQVFVRGNEVLSTEEVQDQIGLGPGSLYSPSQLDLGMQALVATYARRGHLDAKVVIERLELAPEGVIVGIAVSEGPAARLGEVQVQGNTHSRDTLVQRLSGLAPTAGMDSRRLRESTLLLRRSGLFAAVQDPLVYRTGRGNGELGVMLRIVEATQRNTFFGSIGVAQDPRDRRAYVHGAVDLQLRNIWGTGRDLGLAWKRDALAGTNLSVGFRERFLFGWRLDLSLDLTQTVRDSTYTYQSVGGAVVLPLRPSLGLELGTAYDRSVFHVGTTGDAYRLRGRVGLLLQTLSSADDRRVHGRMEVRAEYARKSNSFQAQGSAGDAKVQQTVWSGLYAAGWPMGARHELWSQGVWYVLDSEESEVLSSELYYFGGARTLRGYREDQFRGDQVAHASVEYRFGEPNGSQVYAFVDVGGLRRKQAQAPVVQEGHLGYGLGLRGNVATGVFDIAFGLGEEISWSGAKLHVSLLQRF